MRRRVIESSSSSSSDSDSDLDFYGSARESDEKTLRGEKNKRRIFEEQSDGSSDSSDSSDSDSDQTVVYDAKTGRLVLSPKNIAPADDDVKELEGMLEGTTLSPTFSTSSPTDAASPASPDTPIVEDPNWSLRRGESYYTLRASPRTSPFLPKALFDSLYSHQKSGITWMHDVHHMESEGYPGGILGDDMGLGKTYQTTSYVLGMYYRRFVESEFGFRSVVASQPQQEITHTHVRQTNLKRPLLRLQRRR